MAKSYPTELTNVYDGTEQGLGDGRVRETNVVSVRNHFDTSAIATTTSDTLSLGKIREGDCIKAFEFLASTNMSAASVAIGIAGDTDKYLAATALPNATHARHLVTAGAAGFDPADAGEELIATISGATIPNGDLVIYTEMTRR